MISCFSEVALKALSPALQILQIKVPSCMNIYSYSCLKLLSNRQEATLKQNNPCSNQEIHVAFEHGFYLNIRIACRILFTDVTV